MTVTAPYADYLKSAALYTGAASPDATLWGERAVDQEVVSPFGTLAGADNEAARQILFYRGPLVLDFAVVKGARRDLIGKVVTLTGDRLGYTTAGAVVFCIGVEEMVGNVSKLTVVRRLT